MLADYLIAAFFFTCCGYFGALSLMCLHKVFYGRLEGHDKDMGKVMSTILIALAITFGSLTYLTLKWISHA